MKPLVAGATTLLLLLTACSGGEAEAEVTATATAASQMPSTSPTPTPTPSPTPTGIVVPDIIGMSGDEARSALIGLGLRGNFAPIDNPPEKYNRGHWIVESQSPAPGTMLNEEEVVTFVVAQIGPFAHEVVEAFGARGLPVNNARDNTIQNCYGAMYDCTMLVTTDDISVYEFADEVTAAEWASGMGLSGAHHNRTIVLSYAAARTPDKLKPQYEAVLAELMVNY